MESMPPQQSVGADSQIPGLEKQLTTSLQDFISDLSGQASDLRALGGLIDSSPAVFVDIEQAVTALEAQLGRIQNFADREEAAVNELQSMVSMAQQQIQLATTLAEASTTLGFRAPHIPTQAIAPPLPSPALLQPPPALDRSQSAPTVPASPRRNRGTSSTSPRGPPRSRAGGPAPRASSSGRDSARGEGIRTTGTHRRSNSGSLTRSSSAKSAGSGDAGAAGSQGQSGDVVTQRRRNRPLPQIMPLTEEELNSVPKYQRGRLKLDKLRTAIGEINEVLGRKYQLMGKPVTKLWGADLNAYKVFKAQVSAETRGFSFFCASDVKALPALKGSTGTAVLQVLRHVKRVKAVSGGGHTRYLLLPQ